jgi:hypothetical protein
VSATCGPSTAALLRCNQSVQSDLVRAVMPLRMPQDLGCPDSGKESCRSTSGYLLICTSPLFSGAADPVLAITCGRHCFVTRQKQRASLKAPFNLGAERGSECFVGWSWTVCARGSAEVTKWQELLHPQLYTTGAARLCRYTQKGINAMSLFFSDLKMSSTSCYAVTTDMDGLKFEGEGVWTRNSA